MNSVNIIKALRYTIADDSIIRSLFEVSTRAAALKRVLYKDSVYTSSNAGGVKRYVYPQLGFKFNDDNPQIRGADDNSVMLEITIVNKFKNSSASLVNLQIKDRLKEMLEDGHQTVNAKALTLSPSIVTKVRDISWVSGVAYDDKEQGSERLHKLICNLKLVVGD